jgi:hypothetical protein
MRMSDPKYTRWEYQTIRPPRDETMKEATDPESILNELGSAGWEFVDSVDYVGGGTKFLICKRPRQEVNGDD